jgi:heptosyltransferase I
LTSPPADLREREFRKILLIKLSALGDVVHTIPVAHKLRRRYPAAQLDWLVSSSIAELLRDHPAVDNVIEFVREEWLKPWRVAPFASSARLAAKLRAAGYDLVLDLQGQLRSAVFAFATGAPVRIGFDRPRPEIWSASARTLPADARRHAWQGAREGSWIAYTHHISLPTLDVHAVDRYLSVGPLLNLDEGAADFSFPIPAEATKRIEALMDYYGAADKKLAVLAPATIWETKAWESDGFAEVARYLLQKGFAVTLIGLARERGVCAQVTELAPGAVNLAGETTLGELAALVRRSAISVTNDSGPMHLAAALGRPVVSLFGPTDPIWIGPYRRAEAVIRANLPCSPCYLRQLSSCRHNHDCMREVSGRAVIERVDSVLRKQPGGAGLAKAEASGR